MLNPSTTPPTVDPAKVRSFVGADLVEAVGLARSALGPDAIVIEVQARPSPGWSRFWRRPRVELRAVQAPGVESSATLGLERDRWVGPEPADGEPAPTVSAIEGPAGYTAALRRARFSATTDEAVAAPADRRPVGARALLCRLGLLPGLAEQVLARVPTSSDGVDLPLAEEMDRVRTALLACWRPVRPRVGAGCHVFVGPPGSGKTTVLSKWLTQAVLVEGRRARVWRLDSRQANTAESLSIMAEVLGVPVERRWTGRPRSVDDELWLVDVPGSALREDGRGEELETLLRALPSPTAHLVLNAAYETPLLVSQARDYVGLPIADVIATHLDEETGWGKLWNIPVGTDFSLGYLSTGQNVPGGFEAATPERLLPRFFSGF
ncbi:MAG: flagellar biosynthesis protein FlhF [Limisphaerales bacterium]